MGLARVQRAQLALEHLADLAAGQLRMDDQVGHALGLAHAAVEPLLQVSRLGVATGLGHHIGNGALAPGVRGHADHRAFAHLGVLQQHGLDVAGVDVEAAGDDHVLLAVAQHDEAIGIHLAHIAAADKALAAGADPLGLAGLVGLAVVARHHAGRAADDLALRTLGQLLALFVDKAQIGVRPGAADGVQLVGELVAVQLAAHAPFGHAVVLDQAAGPAAQHLGLERGLERRAGAELVLQPRQIGLVKGRAVQQALVLHGHQHRVGGGLCLGQLQVLGRVELAHHH